MSSVFIIDNTDGTLKLAMQPGTLNGPGSNERDTDLRIYGMGTILWGEGVNENILRVSENWACEEKTSVSPTTPQDETDLGPGLGITYPQEGQNWFNKTNKRMYFYDGTLWIKTVVVTVGTSAPVNPDMGDLWYADSAGPCGNDQMLVYDGSGWVSTASDYLPICGGTLTGPLIINDTLTVNGIADFTSDVDLNNNPLKNVGTPTSGADGMSRNYADARYVNVSGDTMTGTLNITNGNLVITNGSITVDGVINANGSLYIPYGQQLTFGTSHNDPGAIYKYEPTTDVSYTRFELSDNNTSDYLDVGWDDGTWHSSFRVYTSGDVDVLGTLDVGTHQIKNVTDPTDNLDAVNKQFLDSEIASLDSVYVNEAGDTMSGYLTLNANPTNNLHAATKQYVDSTTVSIGGDTMSGFLTLNANPTNNLHAVPKQYLDSIIAGLASVYVNVTGDTMTNFLTLHADPVNNLHAATKQYVDNLVAANSGNDVQFFTASGTWTKPASGTYAIVELWGGGGGGGRYNTEGGGGGGGGSFNRTIIPLSSLSSTVNVIIGSGGLGVSSNAAGGAGGTSSFGTHLYAYGGGRGGYSFSGAAGGGGGGPTSQGNNALVASDSSRTAGGGSLPNGDIYYYEYGYPVEASGDYLWGIYSLFDGGTGGGDASAIPTSIADIIVGQPSIVGGGGGAGAADNSSSFTPTGEVGGASIFGGGGGGGSIEYQTNNNPSGPGGYGGFSLYGGRGGNGGGKGSYPVNGENGEFPAGGGGGSLLGSSGSGAPGLCIVRVI